MATQEQQRRRDRLGAIISSSEHWDLNGMQVTHDEVRDIIVPHVRSHPEKVRRLWLSDNKIGDEGTRHLAQMLTTNTTVTEIGLNFSKIGDEGARHLALMLTTNNTITVIGLEGNKIGDGGARHLAQMLMTNTAITEIMLNFSKITDEGARHLALMLTTNTTIKEIGLVNNKIGDEGAQSFSKALQSNTTIQRLWLDGNNIAVDGLRSLAFAFVTRQVKFWYYDMPNDWETLVEEQELVAKEGAVPASVVKMVLCGNANVGKTTLSKSLRASWVRWLTGVHTQEEDTPGHGRTRGVEVSKGAVGGSSMSIWDVGGQEQYDLLHRFVHGGENSIFVVVVSLAQVPSEREATLKHWLQRLRAGQQKRMSRVVLVGSHCDQATAKRHACKDCAGRWTTLNATAQIAAMFTDRLAIEKEYHVVNCTDPASSDIKQLKRHLQQMHEAVLSSAPNVPTICDRIMKSLPRMRKEHKDWPLVGMTAVAPTVLDPLIRQKIARYLYHAGEILPGSDDWETIVIEVVWLLRDVLGEMFVPSEWESTVRVFEGIITIKELRNVYGTKARGLAEMLRTLCLGVNCEQDGEAALLVPSMLTTAKDISTVFETAKFAASGIMIGRRLVYKDDMDVITAAMFPVVQVKLRHVSEGSIRMWAGGLQIASYGAEGIVRLDADKRGIEVRVGVEKNDDDSRASAVKLMCRTVSVILEVQKQICPGITLEQRVMRASHVRTNVEGRSVVTYSPSDCQNNALSEGKVSQGGVYDSIVEMITGDCGGRMTTEMTTAFDMEPSDPFRQFVPRPSKKPWRELLLHNGKTLGPSASVALPVIGRHTAQLSSALGSSNVRIEVDVHQHQVDAFSIQVQKLETWRNSSSVFNHTFAHNSDQQAQIQLLKDCFESQSLTDLAHCNLVVGFHGCSPDVADNICSTGMADIASLDPGYFGRGIYITPSAEYAAKYARLKGSNTSGEFAMVVVIAAVGLTYPITRAIDYSDPTNMKSHSKFYDAVNKSGFALKPGGFDSHFATVVNVPRGSMEYEQCVSSQPPTYEYAELVLKEAAQVLPIAKIYFH